MRGRASRVLEACVSALERRSGKEVVAAVLWFWFASYTLNQFFYEFHRESTTRGDARLLIDHVCSINRARGDLVQCEAAHAVLSRGPTLLAAVERTLSELFADTWGAARRELSATLRAIGFLGAVVLGVLLFLEYRAKMRSIGRPVDVSPMTRARETFMVDMSPWDAPRQEKIPYLKFD